MSENQLLNVGEFTPLGKVEIAPEVLELIARDNRNNWSVKHAR